MENVIHRLTLDLTGPDTIPRVEVQQDNARSLSISLTQGGRPYWIAEGVTAVFSGRKPDGKPLFNACTIEKNRVVYDFTDQTTNVAGIVECEILLYSGDERILASPRFELAIDELIHRDGDVPESAPEISALTQMVAAGTAMIEDLREALGELEGVEEILTQARAAAEAASGSEAAARGHAKTAAAAAADALTLAGQANSASQQANKYAYEANRNAQRVAVEREAAEKAADDAQTQAVTAGDHAKAAEESAKRAEEAAAGAGGGGISTETVSGMITGHNTNRDSHEDIRQQVQGNNDLIAALNRDKLDAARLPEAINTALAQAQASGLFDGADGRGIKTIARTSGNGAAGTTDTYTITYTDGTKSTYQVRNGANGKDGTDGDDGITPHIGSNGNWYIGDTDTGVKAQGEGGSGSAVVVEAGIRDADAVRDAGRKPMKAMVSFMDDDCRKAVYHRKDTTPNEPSLWELIQELGIPYTLSCPPGSIYDPENPVDGNEAYLTVGELQEMHRGGVGISCHHWRQYNMDDTELLPTEDDYDADLTRCLEKFRAWGITDVLSVAYPQGVIADNYLHVAKRHFRMGFGVTRGINQRPYASYRMDRCETFPTGSAYVADPTKALNEAKARVNDLAETGGWLIFMTHAWYETFSPADLRSLVAYIREQGIEIVGVNDAIRNTGNVVEVGDIVKPMEEQTAPFFVVDAEGNTYTNALHDYTPSGETLTEINAGYNLGYIGGENGTRMSSTDTNRWVSDDIKVQAGEIYRLTCSAVWTGAAYAVLTAASGGTVVDIVAGDANTPSTALTDHDITIPEGGTILRVSSNLTVQPEGYKIYRVESAEGSGSGASVTIDTTLTQSGQAADAKVVGDALKEKQPKGNYLTEAQLKTINGQSLVGEGNIEISGTSQSGKTSFDEFLDNIDVDYAYDSATGANYTVIRVYKNKLDGTKQYPFAVVPDVNEIKYSTLDFMEKFADDNGYLLAINSGLGSPATHQIDGIVVQNGVVVYNTPAVYHAGSMPLTIDVNGDLSYASSNVDANELVANGVVSALCGFCPIIVDYNTVNPPTVSNVTHFTQNAQRQIIGQFGNGDYAIVTCEGRDFDNSDGWTIAEAQTICKKLGLKFAYNLDGGGSTQTVIGKKQLNTIYENEKGRKLPSFIVFNGKTELGVMPDVPDIPTKTLESITATYNGGSVAVGTDLTTLTGIVVTATYSDGSTAIVNGYTLSGEIVEGDNVITVKYSGKTTTITVVGVALSGFIWTIGTTEPNGTWFGQEGPEYHRTALYTTENTGSQVALDIDNNSVVNSHNVPYGAPKKLYLPKIPTGATKLSWSNSDANVLEAVWLYDATGTRITEVGTKYDMASPLDLTKYPNAVYWNCDCKYGTKNATIYANPDSSLPDAYARYQIICDTEFTFS